MQQFVKSPEKTPPLQISPKGREVQRVFSQNLQTDKTPGAQNHNSFPKVIHVREGATENRRASLSLCGDRTAAFWGCLFVSPLPPSSVSTSLGISETSHNKLCSVRKGADDVETDALKQDGLSRLTEPPPRLLTETAGTSQSAKPDSESPPGRSGTPVPYRQPPQPEATGPRNRTSFLRFGKPWLLPGPGRGGGAQGSGPRALRKVHRCGGERAGGGPGPARPRPPADSTIN